ncbi:MAG: TlpA disulfide reductase family protein [Myxococcota bacterium]
MTRRRGLGLAVLGGLALLMAVNLPRTLTQVDALGPIARGRAAPAFRLPALAGGEVALGDLRGSVVLVDFWASWCEPCVVQLPHVERLARRFASRGLRVLAVNAGEPRADVERFVRRAGLSGVTVLLDGEGVVGARYGVRTLPFTLVVDRGGLVRDAAIGPRGERRLAAMVEPWLR